VRRGLDLPEAVQVDPGTLPESERRRLGIEPLPASLDESVRRLEADAVLTAALGPELARAFLAVRRAEAEALRGRDLAEEVRLLWERY
jgi:glutamine synthetase